MDRIIEFIGNHPILCAGLAAVTVFIIVNEIRRKSGSLAVSAQEAVRLINDADAIVLDVRAAADYKVNRILNAKNIPFAKLDEQIDSVSKNKQTPIIAYCKSGSSSAAAANKLKAAGYEQVYYLNNGMFDWQNENLPMEK